MQLYSCKYTAMMFHPRRDRRYVSYRPVIDSRLRSRQKPVRRFDDLMTGAVSNAWIPRCALGFSTNWASSPRSTPRRRSVSASHSSPTISIPVPPRDTSSASVAARTAHWPVTIMHAPCKTNSFPTMQQSSENSYICWLHLLRGTRAWAQRTRMK